MATSKEILKQFSLTDEEADVYLGLLKTGPTGVTDIAKKIKKNRTAVYFHMNKLVEKGIIHQTQQGRALIFSATPPSELAERFDKLTTEFKSIVPQLEALKRAEMDTPVVRVTESRAGYFQMYDEISSLPEGSTFYAIEGAAALQNELSLLSPEAAQSFYKKMVDRNIEVKLILTEEASKVPQAVMSGETLALFKKRRITSRVHPESVLPFQGLTLLYGNTVAHLIPGKDLVITIRQQDIAESFKATFEALFNIGRPHSFSS